MDESPPDSNSTKVGKVVVDVLENSAKCRNWNISDIFFSMSSGRGKSNRSSQKHLCGVWGQCHRREHGKKMVFSF